MSIADLLPGPIASSEGADMVLELAFLMSAVDGHLADEELAAFRVLVGTARGREVTKTEVDDLLEQFVVATQVGVEDRVRAIARMLPVELREVAFKVTVGLSLVDHDASEHEYAIVGILAPALELKERAIVLAREAHEAIEGKAS